MLMRKEGVKVSDPLLSGSPCSHQKATDGLPASGCENPLRRALFSLDVQMHSFSDLKSAFCQRQLSLDNLGLEQRGKLLVGLYSEKPPSSTSFFHLNNLINHV